MEGRDFIKQTPGLFQQVSRYSVERDNEKYPDANLPLPLLDAVTSATLTGTASEQCREYMRIN
jgi:hypothetical protein